MYGWPSKLSATISEPLTGLMHAFAGEPLIFALLLGFIGAVAPCQLTGNMSAITFYGNRTVQMKNNWSEIAFFIAGKVVVFSLLGLLAWLFGRSFETKMTEYFSLFRKGIGPLIMMTGFVLLGILKLEFLHRLTARIPMRMRGGKVGSFLLGASFSLAFCPTMFVIFFLWLMPVVATTSYGLVLPAVFGIATSVPLLLLWALIWLFDEKRLIMKRSRKVGSAIQRFAGILLVIIGLFDTLTFWGV